MSNPRSASNAWAKIKAKLMADNPDSGAAPTPKKNASPKKKAAPKSKAKVSNSDDGEDNANADADGDAPATPAKTPKKRTAKKVDAGDESPKKRGRPAKAKAAGEACSPSVSYMFLTTM
jgi:hypothetical protein